MLFRGSVESGEPKLEYYEDPKDVGTLKPKGVFLLGSAGIKVGYGVGQGGGDTPSETSNTVRLTLPDRTAEITAPNRIQCRAWMQVISQICNEGGFLQQRKRVGVLFVADLGKAKGSQKKLLSTKYEPKWGVLDCAFLKIFDADSDVGSEKSLKLKIPISASTKIVAPGDDGDEVDPTSAVSARFEVIAGGKVYNLQGNSFRETTEWIADIASVQKERAAPAQCPNVGKRKHPRRKIAKVLEERDVEAPGRSVRCDAIEIICVVGVRPACEPPLRSRRIRGLFISHPKRRPSLV